MSVVLRPAAPTAAEGERFAEYFDIAAAGVMRQLFGRRSGEVLTEAFLSTGHDFSFETVVFAEVDGEIVGMSSAYDAAYHGASTMRPVLRAARLSAIRAAAVSLFAWRLFAFLDDVPDGDYYLAALAVDGSRRGEGIGTVLLDDTLERARAAGAERLVLDVDVKNDGGRRLYERWGMTVDRESPSVLFKPDDRVFRMVKTF